MTRLLREGASEPVAKKTGEPVTIMPSKHNRSLEGLAIAASAEAEGGKPKPKSSRKKSAKGTSVSARSIGMRKRTLCFVLAYSSHLYRAARVALW